MFTDDYIMRQIEMLSRSLAKVFFNKDTETLEILGDDAQIDELALAERIVREKTDSRNINEAENYLYELIEEGPTPGKLKLALWFYHELRKMTDEELEAADFSREEIEEGLEGVLKFYNIEM